MNRILVTGCGSIGRRHIANLQRLRAGEILAHDTAAEQAAAAERDFGVRAFTDWRQALARGADAVLVCAPTSLHTALARAALQAGAHVFVEKPLSHTPEGLDELQGEARAAGKVVLVGCNFRFERGMQRVRQLQQEGVLGKIYWADAEFGHYLPLWRPGQDYRSGYGARKDLGGGILLDAYHEFDYLYWLLGDVQSVFCLCARTGSLEIDTEDLALATMRFRAGAAAHVKLDYLRQPYRRSLTLCGEAGTLEWDFGQGTVTWWDAARQESVQWDADHPEDRNQMYVDEMAHFLACIAGEQEPIASLQDAVRVQQVLFAAMESTATGAAVQVAHTTAATVT